jgi:hypothetical protein
MDDPAPRNRSQQIERLTSLAGGFLIQFNMLD